MSDESTTYHAIIVSRPEDGSDIVNSITVNVSAPDVEEFPKTANVSVSVDDLYFGLPLVWMDYLVVISNPGFEEGPEVGWEQISDSFDTLIVNSGFPGSVTPRAGSSYLAWLGGSGQEEAFVLAQDDINIPNMTTDSLFLQYFYWIAANEQDCTRDVYSVFVGEEEKRRGPLCAAEDTDGWSRACIDIIDFVDQSVSVAFGVQLGDDPENSNLFIDDVSLTKTCRESPTN